MHKICFPAHKQAAKTPPCPSKVVIFAISIIKKYQSRFAFALTCPKLGFSFQLSASEMKKWYDPRSNSGKLSLSSSTSTCRVASELSLEEVAPPSTARTTTVYRSKDSRSRGTYKRGERKMAIKEVSIITSITEFLRSFFECCS